MKTNYYNDSFLLDSGGAAPLLYHGGLRGADRPLLGGRLVPGKGPHALPVVAEAQDGGDGGGAAADLGGRKLDEGRRITDRGGVTSRPHAAPPL